ncbi:hypothetical protein GN956_G18438 [Arapaima gigas]
MRSPLWVPGRGPHAVPGLGRPAHSGSCALMSRAHDPASPVTARGRGGEKRERFKANAFFGLRETFHSPHKQPQNHKCGAHSFSAATTGGSAPACQWLIRAGQLQPQRPKESYRTSRVVKIKGTRTLGRTLRRGNGIKQPVQFGGSLSAELFLG